MDVSDQHPESGQANPTRLWGGRFVAGPAEALARLSVSVQFDWRLAPYDLAASRAHARVLPGPGLLDPTELGRILAALDDLESACVAGAFRPGVDDEDVHTALERGLLERLGALGGKLRAGRSRNDQVATDLRLYLRDHARGVAAGLIDLADVPWSSRPNGMGTPQLPGSPTCSQPSRSASPTSCSPTCRRCCAIWTGCGTGTSGPPSARSAPEPSPGRRFRSTRRRSPHELGFPGPGRQLDRRRVRPGLRRRVPVRRRPDRRPPVAARRGARPVDDPGVRLGGARRRASPPGPRSCRRRRTPTSPSWPGASPAGSSAHLTGGAGHAQGAAAGVRPRPAGGQGAGLRRGRHPRDGAAGVRGHDRDHDACGPTGSPRRRPDGFTLATDVAEWLVRRGVPFREAHEITGQLVVVVRGEGDRPGRGLRRGTGRRQPATDPGRAGGAFRAGALAARTTPGSTGPGPVADQLAATADRLEIYREWATQRVIPG